MVVSTRSPGAARLRRAALSTGLVFTLSGALFGTWVARIPATRDRLDAGEAELGMALLAPGLGSLLSMPLTGWLCRRFGSRLVVAGTALPACAMLAALAAAPSLVTLGLTLGVWGMLYGSWDVAMNVHGSAVEQRAGREWMPRYHAGWSLGTILGSGTGALAARLEAPLLTHFTAVAVITGALLVAALRNFIEERTGAGRLDQPEPDPVVPDPVVPDPAGAERTGRPDRRRLLTPRLVIVGLITLCATTVEGAAADWLALYLADERGTTASAAALGFAAFAVAMAVGRFAGTNAAERLGRHGAVRAGGLLAMAGVSLTVLGPGLPSAYAGAVLWGLGISVIFPAAMSAGGEVPDRPSDAIAAVATIGYGGFLIGPPLIGLLAEHAGLGSALLVLLILAGAISCLAPAVRSRQTGRATSNHT